MTCKDCLHYEVCYHYGFEECEWVADKSEWVHLPCKVGDIVYCFEPCFDTDHHPKLKVVEKEIIELKTIATVFGLNFNIDSIGKTMCVTREEAEKALEERRKTSNGGKVWVENENSQKELKIHNKKG